MNIQDVLLYGHIFNDNSNRQMREARKGGYLTDMLMDRYYRCCQAMWYSRKLQNRVRFQIAAVRISPGDVMKAEQRDYWKRNFIDEIMAQTAASKNDPQGDIHTPSFDEDEVDYDRDLLAPVIEEEIDQMEAIRKSAVEHPLSTKIGRSRTLKSSPQNRNSNKDELTINDMIQMNPDLWTPTSAFPTTSDPSDKWRRFPEPVPFGLQEESGCQDAGKGSSGLKDRYVMRCVAYVQVI